MEVGGVGELHAAFFNGKPHTWTLVRAASQEIRVRFGRDDKFGGRRLTLARAEVDGQSRKKLTTLFSARAALQEIREETVLFVVPPPRRAVGRAGTTPRALYQATVIAKLP